MSDDVADKNNPMEGSYPIGYGKPPAQTRFKKGRSGNPSGRPKGTLNFAAALKRALEEPVVINEGGQRRTVTKLDAAVTQLANKSAMGDLRAIKQYLTVRHVCDGELSDVDSVTPTTESDALVIAHLIARLGTLKGGPADDPHT